MDNALHMMKYINISC